ncbi:phospholipid carrier-dependent glycosyltransferase [Streptomyces sp. NPDC046712]|uniref:ArnT family glycosyltransferase n=1 Tax=Streptomyces sp. NPDC046712 TaxID=3154802 RepID=UPI00341094F0
MAVVSRALPLSMAWFRTMPLWAVALAAGLLTGLVRLVGYGQAADVFGDEVYYWRIGHSVEEGGFPRHRGGLFFLHPPGYFYLVGGWEQLFGSRADVIAGIYQVRLLNALLAGISAALLVVLMTRVTRSTWAAVAVGLLFALDPYILRLNGRVLIETSMMLWVLLGYLVLLPLAEKETRARARGRAAAGGLLFGLAILTKDVAALITVLPLLAAVFFVWPKRRSLPLLTAGFACVPYAIYVGIVAAAGHFDTMWDVKTHGVRRLLGQVQETGFNAGGTPPLYDRLFAQVPNYGSTYVLLILAPLAAIPLLRHGGKVERLLGLWYASAAVALVYAVLKGTLEEQELYLLIVPTMVVLAMTAVRLWRRGKQEEREGQGEQGTQREHRKRRTVPRRRRVLDPRLATVFVLALTLAWSGIAYGSARSQPDDGYARLRQYMKEHVPAGTPITSLSGSLTLVLQDRYNMGHWSTPEERAKKQVVYVVVPWRLVEQNYSAFTPQEARHLTDQGAVIFSFHGRTYGEVALYRLPVPPVPLVGDGGG